MPKRIDRPHQLVYVTVGNTDGKLTQNMWCHFLVYVEGSINEHVWTLHGRWLTETSWLRQSACWGFEIFTDDDSVGKLQKELRQHAKAFRQDSIVWAPAQSEMLTPS